MKKLITLLALVVTLITFAQAPQGFNYQATVRNSAGALIVNQNVYFKFNVMLNSATSLPVFSETHMAPTDDLGQVNLVIGQGTATTGSFSTINWGTGNYYLGIELNTGAGYVAMGTTQLLSVPYALYANSSGNAQTPTPNLAAVLAVNNGANNLKITNLAEPTTAQDAATKNYVDNASTGITTLADGSIFVGNASNTATAVALSGDVTISNTGVATISDNAVSTSNITDANITNSKLDKANIPLSGFGAATVDVNLGTKKITNLANPTEIQDAATKQYVDSKIPNGTNVGDNLTWNGTNWVVSSANTTAQLPQLTTTTATGITPFAATSGGTITGDGGFSIISKGVAWSTSPNPTINDNFTNNGSGASTFQSVLTNLLPGTSYYYRGYATNTVGTGYGMSFSLTTQGLATVTTTEIMQINSNSATSGGNITSNGGANVTARGVCWSTQTNPTIALSTKTVNGSGSGLFSSSITQLSPATTYYVRAYATNAAGTAYGNEWSFTTSVALPIVTTNAVTQVTSNTAICGGVVEGFSILARGVCWSTSPNPTIALSTKTVNGSGIGFFNSTITGLTANTTYYIRAYGTNSVGTAYGNEFSFTTVLANVTIGTQIWSNTNLDVTTYRDGTPIPQVTDPTQWANLTTGAWCYYNNDPANGPIYGKLYNWYAVAGIHDNDPNTANKTLAPLGWHIPSDTEWTTLTTYLGGESIAGGKMKEAGSTHWFNNDPDSSNITGFTALPAGNCSVTFGGLNTRGYWWSSTEQSLNSCCSWYREIYNSGLNIYRNGNYPSKNNGMSVRCIQD